MPPQTGYAWQAMCWLSISNEKPPQLPLPRTLRVVNVLPLSISNEKPPQLPQGASIKLTRFWAVSISNEKPPQLPLLHPIVKTDRFRCFNLKREAAPVATSCRGARWNQRCLFQSQTRSRPSCHAGMSQPTASQLQVSISNEKPPQLPLFLPQISARFTPLFQSQTRSRPSCHRCAWQDEQVRIDGFNLKREAAPVATGKATGTGHIDAIVSISNEKPPQLPRGEERRGEKMGEGFNLKREAAPVATGTNSQVVTVRIYVSISNEKPPQLPPQRSTL